MASAATHRYTALSQSTPQSTPSLSAPSPSPRTRLRTLLVGGFLAAALFGAVHWLVQAQTAPARPHRAASEWPAWLSATHRLGRDPLRFRRQLEHTTAPTVHFTRHSRTLSFDRIYVLSLPSREDRRTDIRTLADALALDIEFVDAAHRSEPFLKWIAERVRETRELRKKVMSRARGTKMSKIGRMGTGSDWVTPFPGRLDSPAPARFPPFPASLPALKDGVSAPPHYAGSNWVSHLEALHSAGGRHTSLRPSDPHLNVSQLLWDPLEPQAVRQVHEGIISTYWGQTRALKRMLENGDRTALILEDDVDVEWDIERLWASVERRLPRRADDGAEDWDITFLGHCWGGESQQPQYLHPLVHRSTGPMCLHAYAVTNTGARRLLATMLDPWSAFSTAIDLVVPSLLHIQTALATLAKRLNQTEALVAPPPLELLKSFSIAPPLVVQRKDGPSDLQRGNGSRWRGLLRDSTVERIKRDQGSWTDEWDETYDERHPDPATVVRCRVV
ncbi:hypothetical protein JCM8202_002285 [Rhodotorula sphaerocarpa]